MKTNSAQAYTYDQPEGKGKNPRGTNITNGDALYTVRESSAETGLAYWTIWDYLKKKRLMKTKVGGKTMIRRSELEKLIVDVKK